VWWRLPDIPWPGAPRWARKLLTKALLPVGFARSSPAQLLRIHAQQFVYICTTVVHVMNKLCMAMSNSCACYEQVVHSYEQQLCML